jgi:hypothetical protein
MVVLMSHEEETLLQAGRGNFFRRELAGDRFAHMRIDRGAASARQGHLLAES